MESNPVKQESKEKVAQAIKSLEIKPTTEPIAVENVLSPTNKKSQKLSKEKEYAKFLDDGDAMPTP